MPSYYDSKSSKPKSGKVKKYKEGRSVSVNGDDSITPGHSAKAAIRRKKMAAKKKKMAAGGQVPKTIARGSGAARTQYFRKNG